jgi:CBS domain-containing protein
MAALSASGRVASDVMTADVATITERTSLREAARLMAQQRIKRLPVVDQHGRLVGVVDRQAILRALSQLP